ncbi:MAG: TIGR02281 family clan AA aspartic protease [Rhizobiaceae bacterium]|nr:TIGR02281 family clan AA aspartic protease [Rhizobiaceae bacterium]MCV0405776.1 TIGR02281 family clan AA aspartic protease [Rhizobiaceae bacterium]
MLRSLVIFGVAAVVAATVPSILHRHPDLLAYLIGADGPEAPREPARLDVAVTRMAPPEEALHGSKVRIEPDGRGHWTGEFRMNGTRIQGLVDTGATLVAINRSTAARLGIRPTAADFVHEVGTANGKARAAAVMIDEIEIGRIRVHDVQAVVLEDRALSVTLVGMSFLSKLRRFETDAGVLLMER